MIRRGLAAAAAICVLLGGLAAALAQKEPAQAVAKPAKPRVPPGRDPGGVAVAVIGNGVNYTLPQIADRLARDGEGDLVGLDIADEDGRPLERPGGPAGAGGTALAGVILREAPMARLVPVRTKPGDPLAHGKAGVLVARSPAGIALVAHASTRREEWEPFRQVVTHFAHVLFVVPAGDDGQDLDANSVFPAALRADNVIVVAGVDAAGKALPKTNRGSKTIDVAVAVEGIETVGPNGETLRLWGSNAAAARLTALAARLAAVEPTLKGAALKQQIIALAKPLAGSAVGLARAGWIADAQRQFRPD